MRIKAVFFFIGCISFIMPCAGQIYVGPSMGLNITSVRFADEQQRATYIASPAIGFDAGATVGFAVRKRFFLYTSVLYSERQKVITSRADGVMSNEVKNKFIEMPILYAVDFKFDIGKNKVFKVYAAAGPNISYWLSGSGVFVNSDLYFEHSVSSMPYDVKFNKADDIKFGEMGIEDPNRVQLGLNLAGGFVFEPISYQKIIINARYEFGGSYYSRTSDGKFSTEGTYESDPMKIQNRGIKFTFSYLIDLRVDQRKKGKSTVKKKHR